MCWTMTRAAAACRPSALGGRLVGLLVLAVIVLGAVGGSSFSTHVGMSTAASGVSDRHQDRATAPAAASSPAEADEPAGVASPVPTSAETQHLMHLLGACLTLLVLGLVLPVLRRLRGPHGVRAPELRLSGLLTFSWAGAFPTPHPPAFTTVLRI